LSQERGERVLKFVCELGFRSKFLTREGRRRELQNFELEERGERVTILG
jgi:hypothetical protein